MNWAVKAAAFFNPARNQCCSHLRLALFHSTPVLEQKRKKSWGTERSYSSRRFRRLNNKQSLLRNFNAYADYILQDIVNDGEPSSSRSASWFKQQYYGGLKKQKDSNHRTRRRGRKGFQFCDDYDEDTIFRSAYGRSQFFFWSYMKNEDDSWWGDSYEYYNRRDRSKWDHNSNSYYRNSRCRFREGYDTSSKFDSSESHFLALDRLALGLSASGPLELEDVKTAYRACALKWHPDRHEGSSKADAEERFKLCSAAYQSLCDKLAEA